MGPEGEAGGGTETGSGGNAPEAGGMQTTQQQSGASDTGFPPNTPVAEMTDAQRAAYFKHQNRQSDNKLAAFKGVTPEDVSKMQAKLQEMENAQLSASDKALKEAATNAAAAAKAEADAAWRPKYQQAQLKSIAAPIIQDKDRLNAFLETTDATKFAGEDGEIDTEKVMGHLTALFGTTQQGNQQQQQQRPAWGQHSGGTPPARPGETGRAAVERRHRTKNQ